mmetsp:Transcript_132612/g.383364  ORF Transcript_132612/g.383364 Transcript_132612/m.383364 type:complete len:333 (-) Transcript_132612:699-1697(-)
MFPQASSHQVTTDVPRDVGRRSVDVLPPDMVRPPMRLNDGGADPCRCHPIVVLAAVLVVRPPSPLDSLGGHLAHVLLLHKDHSGWVRAEDDVVSVFRGVLQARAAHDAGRSSRALDLTVRPVVVGHLPWIRHRMPSAIGVDDVHQPLRMSLEGLHDGRPGRSARLPTRRGGAAHGELTAGLLRQWRNVEVGGRRARDGLQGHGLRDARPWLLCGRRGQSERVGRLLLVGSNWLARQRRVREAAPSVGLALHPLRRVLADAAAGHRRRLLRPRGCPGHGGQLRNAATRACEAVGELEHLHVLHHRAMGGERPRRRLRDPLRLLKNSLAILAQR